MKKIQLHIDQGLFGRIAAGDHRAFETLVQIARDNIFSHAIAYLKDFSRAQDITQDVFLTIWANRASLKEVINPRSYLFILTRNKIVAGFRDKIKYDIQEPSDNLVSGTVHWPAQLLENKELAAKIQEAITRLPPQQQKVFELGKLEGHSYAQIADLLKISPHTVKAHMVQALAFVRAFVQFAGSTLLFFKFF